MFPSLSLYQINTHISTELASLHVANVCKYFFSYIAFLLYVSAEWEHYTNFMETRFTLIIYVEFIKGSLKHFTNILSGEAKILY